MLKVLCVSALFPMAAFANPVAQPEPVTVQDLRDLVQVVGMTCFSSGEQTSGLNKICFYECATGDVAITVRSYQICPITIRN